MDDFDRESFVQCARSWMAEDATVHIVLLGRPLHGHSIHSILATVDNETAILPIVEALQVHYRCAIAVGVVNDRGACIGLTMDRGGVCKALRLVTLTQVRHRAPLALGLHLTDEEIDAMIEYLETFED